MGAATISIRHGQDQRIARGFGYNEADSDTIRRVASRLASSRPRPHGDGLKGLQGS